MKLDCTLGRRGRLLLLVFITINWSCRVVSSLPVITKIGIVSDGMTVQEETALNFSLDYANRVLLDSQAVKLVDVRGRVQQQQFALLNTVCSLLKEGVSVLIGILSNPMIRLISITSNTYRIPLFVPTATNPRLASVATFPYLVRQSPPDSLQSEALVDLIKYYRWKRMAILTSDSEYGVNGLVRLQNLASYQKWTIYSVQSFESSSDGLGVDARALLENIKASGVRIVILHCNTVEGQQVLQQASEIGMTSLGWQWIVTNGITSSDLMLKSPDMVSTLQGLLGTRLTVKQTPFLDRVTSDWRDQTGKTEIASSQGAIMDAVFSIAYASASYSARLQGESLSCHNPSTPWSRGTDALLAFTQVSGNGILGTIEYEAQQPKTATYQIVSLVGAHWEQIGTWRSDADPLQRLQITNRNVLKMGGVETVSDFVSGLANKTIRVACVFEDVFLFPKDGVSTEYLKNLTEVPVDLLQGYVIDFILKLQDVIGFNISMYVVPSGTYGNKNPSTGEWDGLISEMVGRRADIGIGAIFITRDRKEDIDYTTPFMDLGLQIIMKKPTVANDAFRFFAPLSPTLWAYIGGTLFVVSFIITIINKLSPYDHHGSFIHNSCAISNEPKKQKKFLKIKKKSLEQLNFLNATWMSVASLLQQGTDKYPQSLSGQITAAFWFFLVLLVTSTYTANLSAFLTQSRMQGDIQSVGDLAEQTQINYGAVTNSDIVSFFETSSVSMYQMIFNYMRMQNSGVADSAEGIKRARAGGYAFIHDSTFISYEVQKPPCELRLVGNVFGNLGYGFTLQKNSPFIEELSAHILQLRERGFFESLRDKWLTVPNGCAAGNDNSDDAGDSRLGFADVRGVFYVIIAGIGLSFVFLIVEWIVACFNDVVNRAIVSHHPKTWINAFHWRKTRLWKELNKDYGRCAASPNIVEKTIINGAVHPKAKPYMLTPQQQQQQQPMISFDRNDAQEFSNIEEISHL